MRFENTLLEGKLVRRLKRFSAQVKLASGEEITAHLVHPGNLSACSDPGSKVLLSQCADARRRYTHQIEIVYNGRTAVGIHCGRPVQVLMEALVRRKLPELAGYATMERIVETPKIGATDILLAGNGLRPCHIAVRNATLAHEQVAYYPDSQHSCDISTFRKLTDLVREGRRAVIFVLVARADAEAFRPADHVDPETAHAFRDAAARGCEVLCWRARVTRRGIELEKALPIDMG